METCRGFNKWLQVVVVVVLVDVEEVAIILAVVTFDFWAVEVLIGFGVVVG